MAEATARLELGAAALGDLHVLSPSDHSLLTLLDRTATPPLRRSRCTGATHAETQLKRTTTPNTFIPTSKDPPTRAAQLATARQLCAR